MKQKAIIVLSLLALAVSAFALAPIGGKFSQKESLIRDTNTWIDANLILMFVTNKGSIAYDQPGSFGKNDGLYFPFTGTDDINDGSNTTSVIFASGIWVGAVVVDSLGNLDTLVSIAEYADDFYPGPMIGNTFDPGSETDPADRVYKLYSDSLASNPNQDYLDWPVADGAPVDSLGNPDMLGDQMLWAVYNDANPAPHTNDASSTVGLGVEIRQTTFAFAREGALANIVFVKYQIFNKGGKTLTDMFVSLWADPDLGNAGDDFVGSDTALSLGYCYNDGPDSDYGDAPPAVGYDFFQGPLVFTGDNADTAVMWNFTKFPGYQNLPMTSFNKYINGTDPQNLTWTYQYMNGLDASTGGTPLIDPTNGDTVKFFGLGDPVAGTGWIDNTSSDRRYMLTTGPFDFAPGDSTEIVAAIIVGQGSDQLNSITQLKLLDVFAQTVYDREFILPDPPAPPDAQVAELNGELSFSWGTASEDNPGDYQFEGYAVFQGESPTGPWTDTLGWWDIQNGVGAIIDSFFNSATGGFFPRIVKPGPDKGLQRWYETMTDKLTNSPLRNYTDYFFRVEAYSFDTTAVKGERTLTSATVMTVKPQPTVVGTDFNSDFDDDITGTHLSGVSDGSVTASVIDPLAITGDNYQVSFFIDSIFTTVIDSIDTLMVPPDTFTSIDITIGIAWNLINTTLNDTMITRWLNQEVNEDYPIVDGLLIKVLGPPPGFKNFEVVENGAGPLSPPSGAALDFAGFPALRPDDAQQVGEGHWAIHTGDTQPNGSRGSFAAFLSRVLRIQNDFGKNIKGQDFEWRFTGSNSNPGVNGGYAWDPFDQEVAIWVPFEIWRTGVDTPNDPSDDVRLAPWMIDNSRTGAFDLESYGDSAAAPVGYVVGDPATEHSASGANNDPFTDWVYWFLPVDDSPGDAGYQAFEASILADPVNHPANETELMARMVLINWNGDTSLTSIGQFNQDMPEVGTIFRITTNKPNGVPDLFSFSTAAFAPTVATTGTEDQLSNIKTVPNPYYLFSSYDNNQVNRRMKFINLPPECTISIYNLAGDFVLSIDKTDPLATEIEWDVTNSFNVPVASGIYIYVVDAPGFGQKIGKMAIFTEIEILGQY